MRLGDERTQAHIGNVAKSAVGSGDGLPPVLNERERIVETLRQRLASLDRGELGIAAARALAEVRKAIGMKRPRRL
jgi:hypothetical protein